MLSPDAVRLYAAENVTEAEREVIERLDLGRESLVAVLTDCDRFPIAENTSRRGGLDLDSLARLLSDLCALPNWRALTLTEINPGHAPDEQQSFGQLIAMLGDVLEHRQR
jgi:arginase